MGSSAINHHRSVDTTIDESPLGQSVVAMTDQKTSDVARSRLQDSCFCQAIIGISKSRIFRALASTALIIGLVFFLISNPVGWIASTASGISILIAKVILAIVTIGVFGVSLSVQIRKTPKIAFELSALWRLISLKANHNEIQCPAGTTFGLPKSNASKLFVGALPNRLQSGQVAKALTGEKGDQKGGVLAINEAWEVEPMGLSVPHTQETWDKMGVQYGRVNVVDHTLLSAQDMDEAAEFIHRQRQSGHNVLVHCRGGVGRSTTSIAAYLMKYARDTEGKKFSIEKICQIICESRPNATIWNKLLALNAYDAYLITNGTAKDRPTSESLEYTSKLAKQTAKMEN